MYAIQQNHSHRKKRYCETIVCSIIWSINRFCLVIATQNSVWVRVTPNTSTYVVVQCSTGTLVQVVQRPYCSRHAFIIAHRSSLIASSLIATRHSSSNELLYKYFCTCTLYYPVQLVLELVPVLLFRTGSRTKFLYLYTR